MEGFYRGFGVSMVLYEGYTRHFKRNPNYLRIFLFFGVFFIVFCCLLSSAFLRSSAFRLLCFSAFLLLSFSASLASLLFCFFASLLLLL